MVVVLANGERPVAPECLRVLTAARRAFVCCDGAYETARGLGIEPDFAVGDGDSLARAGREALGARFVLETEQETNDLCKAFRFAAARYGAAENYVILGATGLREDHALGNIFHLVDFSARVSDVRMITNSGVFEVVESMRTFDASEGDAVSIFAPVHDTRISTKGLQWPLEDAVLPFLWSGTLNRAAGDGFSIAATHPILVYRPHVRKRTDPSAAAGKKSKITP